jgi:RHS repeat-associated protein
MQQLQVSVDNHYIELGIPPGPPTIQGINGQPEYTQSSLPISQITDYSGPPRNWPQPTFNPDTTGAPGPPVWFTTDSINNELVKAGFGFQDHKITAEIVNSYLHIDHTESTVGISDANGDITAIFSYSPFGEILYSENIKSDHTSSYRFNRKSFDQISQQYFYGSRYYDPETSIWNSVDPLSSQYPEWSPYAFSFHNPQTYIDRDGNFPGDLFSSPEKAAYDFGKIYNPLSININREYGARIQRVRSRKDGKHYYRYNPPVIGDKDGLDLGPKANGTIADVHTHGAWLPRYDNNEFSPADRHGNRSENTIGFVVTPNGFLKKYNPKTRKTEILSKKLPYDKKHYGPTNPYRSQKKTRPVSKGFRPGNAQNKRMAARWDFINDQGTAKKNNRKRPKPIRN